MRRCSFFRVDAVKLLALCGVCSFAMNQHAAAQSASVVKVDASIGTQYDSNPYLLSDSNTDSASIDGELRPSITLIEKRGTLALEGYYRRQEFLRRYSGTSSYGGTLSGSRRFNERTTLSGSLAYTNAIIDAATLFGAGFAGAGNAIGSPPVGTAAPSPVVIPQNPGLTGPLESDLGLIGLRQRRSQLTLNTNLTFRPDQRDTWMVGVTGDISRYPGSVIASSFRSYGLTGGYTRTFSEKRTVGITATAQFIDYDGAAQSSQVFTPQITATQRLPYNWTLEAGAGVSIVRESGSANSNTATSFAFQASACHEGVRAKLCVSGTRSATASGINGVGPQTSARLSYSYRLTERSTLNANASYNSISRNSTVTLGQNQRFILTELGYRRSVGRRLQLFLLASYQNRDVTNESGQTDVYGRAGLSFLLGDKREQRQ
ncbi:hypothetical protein BH09PSE3_BH09PSE3_00040 [soil metagenome]